MSRAEETTASRPEVRTTPAARATPPKGATLTTIKSGPPEKGTVSRETAPSRRVGGDQCGTAAPRSTISAAASRYAKAPVDEGS